MKHIDIDYLDKCVQNLRNYNMKLNPHKCSFALGFKKFLGFMVSERGIEANRTQIQAIMDMASPRTTKKVEKKQEN